MMCQTASWFIRFRNLLVAKRITVLTSNTLCFCYSFLHITFSHFVISSVQFRSVQSLSHVWLFVTPWTTACQASLSITNSQTHVHCVGDAIQSSHPMLSPSPPALNLSSIRVFSNESALHIRWLKYCPGMSMFTLAISCLTTSNLPWFMDLTFQVPMQYCSLSSEPCFYHQSHP